MLENEPALANFSLTRPATLQIRVSIQGDTYLVQGVLNMAFETSCARCLERLVRETTLEFEDLYLKDGMNPEEYEASFPGNVFVLEDLQIRVEKSLEAALAEHAHEIHYCAEACKGLCPDCGGNLNLKDCHCSEEYIDPRLEALKKFKK